MSNQSSIYNEKKIATYEGAFKLNAFAKQQDVNMTLTAEHLYGLAYIVEQTGTIEGDPVYTRFSCSFDEVTKVYTGENQKQTALYIQCDRTTKGTLVRRRIVVPGLKNSDEAANQIIALKEKYDEKHSKPKESARKAEAPAPQENIPAEPALTAAPEVSADTSKNKKDIGGDIKKGIGSVKKRVENINPKELFAKATKSKAILRAPVSVEITEKVKPDAEAAPASFTGTVVDSDEFFNNIRVPKKDAPEAKEAEEKAVEAAEEKTAEAAEEKTVEAVGEKAAEAAEEKAVPEAVSETEAAPEPVPEPETVSEPEAIPEAVSEPVPEEAPEAAAEAAPASRPKVTIEDLMKLNDSIDDDFLRNTEPPISGGKENADRYLESIGGDYTPAAKPEVEIDYAEPVAEAIVLEDMNDFIPASTLPEIDELPDVIDASKLISDMTGGAVDITNETTPVERMDFIPKSHRRAAAAAAVQEEKPEDIAGIEEIPSISQLESIETITEITEAAEPEPIAEPEPEAVTEPEPIAEPVPEAAIEPESVAEPEPEAAIEPEPIAEPEPEAAIEPEPIAEPEPEAAIEPEPIAEPEPEAAAEPEPVSEVEPIAEPQQIAAEDAYISDETVAEAPAEEPAAEITEPAPEVTSVHIDFSTEVTNDTSLEDFEERVKKLKSMLDSGLISKEEFTAEKKKLLETLY